MISVVVSMFTAPVNVFIDFLFEDILLAPTSDRKKQVVSKVAPILSPRNQTMRRQNSKLRNRAVQRQNSTLMNSMSSRLLISEKQKLDIPTETAAAHSRATMLVSRTLSQVASRRNMDFGMSVASSDENIDELFRKMIRDIERQRESLKLNRRQLESFDRSWR